MPCPVEPKPPPPRPIALANSSTSWKTGRGTGMNGNCTMRSPRLTMSAGASGGQHPRRQACFARLQFRVNVREPRPMALSVKLLAFCRALRTTRSTRSLRRRAPNPSRRFRRRPTLDERPARRGVERSDPPARSAPAAIPGRCDSRRLPGAGRYSLHRSRLRGYQALARFGGLGLTSGEQVPQSPGRRYEPKCRRVPKAPELEPRDQCTPQRRRTSRYLQPSRCDILVIPTRERARRESSLPRSAVHARLFSAPQRVFHCEISCVASVPAELGSTLQLLAELNSSEPSYLP